MIKTLFIFFKYCILLILIFLSLFPFIVNIGRCFYGFSIINIIYPFVLIKYILVYYFIYMICFILLLFRLFFFYKPKNNNKFFVLVNKFNIFIEDIWSLLEVTFWYKFDFVRLFFTKLLLFIFKPLNIKIPFSNKVYHIGLYINFIFKYYIWFMYIIIIIGIFVLFIEVLICKRFFYIYFFLLLMVIARLYVFILNRLLSLCNKLIEEGLTMFIKMEEKPNILNPVLYYNFKIFPDGVFVWVYNDNFDYYLTTCYLKDNIIIEDFYKFSIMNEKVEKDLLYMYYHNQTLDNYCKKINKNYNDFSINELKVYNKEFLSVVRSTMFNTFLKKRRIEFHKNQILKHMNIYSIMRLGSIVLLLNIVFYLNFFVY